MNNGRSVRLFLAEGSSTGILTAEIVNWTGHVVSAPRTKLEKALKRGELKKTGIYLLIGFPLDADLPQVYVGEGDDISLRLVSHSRDETKNFWERFVAITNKDMNLTKAHVKYLEGRLISLLKEAKESEVLNRTEPTFDRLPEADLSDMEAFLDHILLLLPVIGIDLARRPKKAHQVIEDASPHVDDVYFKLSHARKGIDAHATEIEGQFVVLKGSVGSMNEAVSFHEKLKTMRDQLLAAGKIVSAGEDNFRLVDDVALSSPSAAAVFLFGTSRNGRTDWVSETTGQTYGDWKDSLLE